MAASPPRVPPDAPRVLIVEDDPRIARLLQEVLRLDGYRIEHATDGLTGLARIAEGMLDLVLLDLTLPGLSGLELCRRARAAAPRDDVYLPIIMVTGLASVAERREGFAAGADDYIPKPFDPAELLARVQVWLRVRAQGKANRAALLRQQAALREAERQTLAARLEGVLLTAREMADLLINDMQGPVGTLDLLQGEATLPLYLRNLVEGSAASLAKAACHLRHLQQVVRVATKQTPTGPALDLERSIQLQAEDYYAPRPRPAPCRAQPMQTPR
jgi:DNA-binding response OmpR family regulator